MSAKKKKPVKQKHIPQRTCVICRQKTDKRQLTRVVRTADKGVIVDPTGKQNGRGAYVCNKISCWNKLQTTSILDKALLTEITAEEKAVIGTHRPSIEQ